ncbi:putative Ig domain-containing protein, partial [Arthrobacter alkaliphilus]|uniref:putative Ig domain-containing protein n=1 Tax=Arthrobacter alkaliphilus TaxID=369936 RepID=UPI001F18E891
PLVISDGVLHDGVAGARYLEQVTATGGTQPVTWTATGLPSGLTLTPDGALAGIPANTGTTTVTLTATDAAGTQATATRILNVPTTMPAGCAGTACAVLTASTRTVQVPA